MPDAARLTDTIYHAPYLMISPEGVSIMASPAAVGARFTEGRPGQARGMNRTLLHHSHRSRDQHG